MIIAIPALHLESSSAQTGESARRLGEDLIQALLPAFYTFVELQVRPKKYIHISISFHYAFSWYPDKLWCNASRLDPVAA